MKAGLEVHQQLATGKLFCRCPTELTDLVQAQITRQLRATGGELHTVDPAAAFQASRGWTYVYETGPSNCLVEVDEEPPHPLNPEALAVALTVALMLHARPVDEIEVMRKIVVDGSNTTGFQRTALIALDGSLELGGKRYSIPTICLEEDAARKVGEGNGQVRYRLDRLGVPLIEIATGPEITNGAEARAVAAEIGALLRSTQRVRRGIGTIREDLNVSTEGGARIEIKGVQELRLLNRYAELEEKRQRSLLELRERLRRQGASRPLGPVADLTEIFGPVTSGALALASRPNRKVLGLVLPGFASMLGTPDREGGERLGRELADQARSVGLKGIVHSDELPNGQVTEGVVAAARQALGCTPSDAFVLVAVESESQGAAALERVRFRASAALDGVPSETRDPLPDGRTRYSRPLPGRDRMYPETDIPPIPLSPDLLRKLAGSLPEHPTAARERFRNTYRLSAESMSALHQADALDLFEALVAHGNPASLVVRLLTQDLPAAEAEVGAAFEAVGEPELLDLLESVRSGVCSKEAMAPVLVALGRGAPDVAHALQRAGIAAMTPEQLNVIIARILEANTALIQSRGREALSALMGDVMREVRGRRDGKEVAERLQQALAQRLRGEGR